MFRTRYIRFLIIAAAAVATACTADPVDPADPAGYDPDCDAEPASLTINFSIADIGIDVSTRAQTPAGSVTRAGTGTSGTGTSGTGTPGTLCEEAFDKADLLNPDNPLTEPDESASDAEKYRYNDAALVNGSLITNLTVILVNNRTNRIVGVRRIPDPDCPNHDKNYVSSGQSGEGLNFPPPSGSDAEAETKENCILKADGSLGAVLTKEDGTQDLDDAGRIKGIVGTRACVTFKYNKPFHIVNDDMLAACAKKLYPTDTEAQKKFIEDNKQYIGKSAEKLLRGEYTVLAVANYDHRVTTSSVTTSSGDEVNTLNTDTTLEEIANEFHKPENMANGLYPFAPADGKRGYRYFYNVRFLMNYLLNGDKKEKNPYKPYIRPAVHQTLTAAKEFTLTAGDNHLDLELVRIASRTRVEVKNYGTIPLKVHSLKFSPNYTQSTCYLFRRNKNNRDYSELATNRAGEGIYTDHDGKGAPMVGYTGVYNYIGGKTYGAIVPFVKDWDSDGKDGADGVKVETNDKRCIFDALMYESHLDYKDDPADPDSFLYTIDVSYPEIGIDENGLPMEKGSYKTFYYSKIDPDRPYKKTECPPEDAMFEYETEQKTKDYIHNPTADQVLYKNIQDIEAGLNKDENGESKDMGESLCFLIKGVGSTRYLYEKEDGTIFADERKKEINLNTEGLVSYLWKLEGLEMKDDGKYYCYLTNLRSGKHMPAIWKGVTPTDANHMMSTDDTTSPKYQLGVSNRDNNNNVMSEYSVTFSNTYDDGTTYYLSVWAEGTYLSGWTGADQGCQYQLYPVKMSSLLYEGTPRMKKTVELTAFSDATGYVEKVREIQRNDFIRILVEVSYHPDASDFMFKVNSWKEKTGTVDFH